MTAVRNVENFDSLPDSAYIRIKDLQVLLAMSESTIRKTHSSWPDSQGQKPFHQVAAYNVGEVRQALANL